MQKLKNDKFATFALIILLLVSSFALFNIGKVQATTLFSDGFDDGTINAWTNSYGSGGTLTITNTLYFGGIYSAKIGVNSGTGNYYLAYKDLSPQTTVFMRFYIRFATNINSGTSVAIGRINDVDVNPFRIRLMRESGGDYKFSIGNHITSSYYNSTVVSLSLNTWYCVETKVKADNSAGELRLWFDGSEILTQTGLDTYAFTNLGTAQIELYSGWGSQSSTVTFYFDSVVISTNYIGEEAITQPQNPLFFDSFEYGTLVAWTGNSTGFEASISVSNEQAHHGLYSTKAHIGSYTASAKAYVTIYPNSSTLYARAYFYFLSIPATGTFVDVMTFKGNGSDVEVLSIQRTGGGTLRLAVEWSNLYTTYTYDYAFLANTWYSLEMMIAKSPTLGEVRAYINGAEVITQTGLNTSIVDDVDEFQTGITYSNAAKTLYVDDTFVSTTGPIGVETSPLIFGVMDKNTRKAASYVTFDISVTGQNNLSKYIYSWNNSGTWVNQTASSYTSLPNAKFGYATMSGQWYNQTGRIVSVKVYANDTSGNWAISILYTFTLTSFAPMKVFSSGFEDIVKTGTNLNFTGLNNFMFFQGAGSGAWIEGLDRNTPAFTSHQGSRSLGLEVNSTIAETKRSQLDLYLDSSGLVGDEYYFRAWYYLPSNWVLNGTAYDNWLAFGDPYISYPTFRPLTEVGVEHPQHLGVINPRYDVYLEYAPGQPFGTTNNLNRTFYTFHDFPFSSLLGNWFKIEWYVKRSDSWNSTITVWLNNIVIANATDRRLTIGQWWYLVAAKIYYSAADPNPKKMWIDDLEIWDAMPTTSQLSAPENLGVTIMNMDAGNYVTTKTKNYDFQALYYDPDGFNSIANAKIAFSDGINWVNASYSSTNGFSLDSGDNVVILSGSVTNINTEQIQIDFEIYFKDTIKDCQNVDIYMYAIDNVGLYDGWEIKQTNYFNIYNLGGGVTYEFYGNAGRIKGGDWNNLYAETASWAKASIVFRNLKYVDAIFSLDYLGNLSETENDTMNNKGYFYFGLDYNINGTWVDGIYVRLELLDIDKGGGWPISTPANWAVFNTTWWYRNQLIKYDYLACWYEGIATNDYRDTQRFHIRLWFNKANASSMIDGWIQEVFYGWTPSGNWMWSGSAGPKNDAQNAANAEAKDSFLFTDLKDSDGNIVSSTQINFVRFWVKVERNTDSYGYIYKIKATPMLNFQIGNDMYGVDTPAPIEPTLPSEAQSGGILGWLGSVFGGIAKWISDAIGPSLLNFWGIFVAFLDSVFTALGWLNGFSQILSIITNFVSWIPTALTQIFQFFVAAFTFITGTFVTIASLFVQWFNSLASIWTSLVWIWNSVLPYWWWIPEVIVQILPILFFLGTLWLFWPLISRMDAAGLHETIGRFQDTIGIVTKIVMFLWKIVDFSIDVIYRLAEMIPIVE